MIRSRFRTDHHFTVSIFGCQYHADEPNPDKAALISRFDALIKPAALRVEELGQNDLPSKIWMSYWDSPQSFKAWWERPEVQEFWVTLPLDSAGFWRETVSLPATRAMYMCNKWEPTGFGNCGELIDLTERFGYWGSYRSRMTAQEDKFATSLEAVPPPKAQTGEIRAGRTKITSFPDNLCVAVEGQDYSAVSGNEKKYWDDNFDALAKQWITNVMKGGPSHGLVSARACHSFGGGKVPDAGHVNGANGTSHNGDSGKAYFPGLDYKRQAQILFWLDLSKMERMGREDRGHVKLRREFLAAYGPGGDMFGGELMLWVDLGVLKGEEMDAEYVGCYEGTGFLAYDGHPSFKSEAVEGKVKLPVFFDTPIESKPEEG